MARANYQITIKIDNKFTERFAELITCIEEVSDLVPEWNSFELKPLRERFSKVLSELYELKK